MKPGTLQGRVCGLVIPPLAFRKEQYAPALDQKADTALGVSSVAKVARHA